VAIKRLAALWNGAEFRRMSRLPGAPAAGLAPSQRTRFR